MPGSPGFKKCASCGEAMPVSDGHSRCIRCLGEGHIPQKCGHCAKLTARTRRDREMRLKMLLFNKALQPPPTTERETEGTHKTKEKASASSRSLSAADSRAASGHPQAMEKPSKARSTSAPSPALSVASAPPTRPESAPSSAAPSLRAAPQPDSVRSSAPRQSAPSAHDRAPNKTAPVAGPAPKPKQAPKPKPQQPKAPDTAPRKHSAPRSHPKPSDAATPHPQGASAPHRTDRSLEVEQPSQSPVSAPDPTTLHPQVSGQEVLPPSSPPAPQSPCLPGEISDGASLISIPDSPVPHTSRAVPTKAQRKTHHPRTPSPGSDRAAFSPGPSISPQRRRSHYHEYSPARRYYRSPRRSITPPHYHRSYYSRSPYRYSYRSRSPRSPTRSRYYRHRSTLSYSPQYSRRASRHRSPHSERSRSISRRSPLSPSRQQIYSPTTQGSIPPAQRPPAPTGDASTTSVPQDDTTQSPVAEHQSVASPTDVASSSPDDAVFNDEPPLADDYKQFHELFTRVADSQNLRTSGAPPKHHPLLRNLQHSSKSKLALPFDAAILEVANDIWQTPASMPPTNKRTDRKYFIDAKDAEFLFTHPVPNSIVVDAAQQKARSAQARNSIADKEAKRLDLLGRKVYSSATATLRMANYSAHLANHDFDNYSKLVPLIQHLPHSQREVLKAIVQEGYTVARNALQISLDIADSASRTTATSIVMRRDSWLHLASVPKDLHPKVEDLPFDRASLFAQNTDQVFHSGKDSRNTLRTLGMYTPPFRCRRAWPYNRQRPPPSSASYYTNQRFRPYDQHRQRQRPQRRRQQSNKANNQQQSRQQV